MDLTSDAKSLGSLRAVFRTALLAVLDPLRVEHAAQNVIADAGQVLDPATANHHHRMFLEIVALAGDIADDLEAVGQANLRDLAKRRVRLFRRGRVDARADAALLRARLEMAGLLAVGLGLPRFADQLANRRHVQPFVSYRFGPARKAAPLKNSAHRRAKPNAPRKPV